MKLNQHLFELVDIIDITSSHHYNMIDITVEDDESFILSNGIVSHNSAKASISEARNPAYIGAFALTGKINNVYGCTPAQVLAMGKLTELLTVIGLTPGKRAHRSLLHYGKIIISTDSDEDGNDIMTLLINLFYQFWPELLDSNQPPIIHRLIAPNVIVAKGKQRIHFSNRQEYEQSKERYRSWEVTYCKGLGSMEKIDWEMILKEDSGCFVPFIADDNFKPTLELLFGPNAEMRKEWLTK